MLSCFMNVDLNYGCGFEIFEVVNSALWWSLLAIILIHIHQP